MPDIYQEIWNVDQAHSGLRAIKKGEPVSDALRQHGYVVVDEKREANANHRLLREVHIPANKLRTYELAEALFDNYMLEQTKREEDFPDELDEVQVFIDAVYKTPPMALAKEYVAERTERTISDDEWWSVIERVWFERFDQGINRDLSGFEHVIVGEQKQGKVQGYHFWYKYHLDEHITLTVGDQTRDYDLIDYLKGIERGAKDVSPDIVTLSFVWRAFDYKAKAFRPLTKPVGGFWVGPSIEGMMAIATVRCLPEAMAPRRTVINGVVYNLPLHRSPNERNLRTFYPEFVRMAQDGE